MSAPPADFVAPLPKGTAAAPRAALPCPFTAQGMLQPSSVQPPPMFGPRGATIPPKHLHTYGARGGGHERGGRGGGRPPFRPRGDNPQQVQKPRFQTNNPKPAHTFYHHPPPADVVDSLLPHNRREFTCEPCDREFRTADELTGHRAQHQRCSVDGCPFEGHAQLVASHVQQQHQSGLYDRIKNLNTPEEIERWREERRRRYPSKQNVALRQQIQEVRQQRGERLAQESKSRFGQKGDRRPIAAERVAAGSSAPNQTGGKDANGGKAKKRRKRKAAGKDAVAVDAVAKGSEQVEPEVMNGTLNMFKGTSQMKHYKRPRVKVVNALSGLLGAYASDEDDDQSAEENTSSSEDDEQNAAEPATVVEVNVPLEIQPIEQPSSEQQSVPFVEETIIESINENMDDDDPDNGPPDEDIVQRISTLPEITDAPATLPTQTTDDVPKPSTQPSNKRPQQRTAGPDPAAKRPKPTSILDLSRRYRNQNTMLEKLLQKDIRHERNVLLQCVRYVVENRFFGVGQEPQQQQQQAPETE